MKRAANPHHSGICDERYQITGGVEMYLGEPGVPGTRIPGYPGNYCIFKFRNLGSSKTKTVVVGPYKTVVGVGFFFIRKSFLVPGLHKPDRHLM